MKDASSLLCEESEDLEDEWSSRSRRSGTESSGLVEWEARRYDGSVSEL